MSILVHAELGRLAFSGETVEVADHRIEETEACRRAGRRSGTESDAGAC